MLAAPSSVSLRAIVAASTSPWRKDTAGSATSAAAAPPLPPSVDNRSQESLLAEVEKQFEGHLCQSMLLELSRRLQDQFEERMQSSPTCMLPSYNHTLPKGSETGTYLALDVGGSTLRVALVELSGRCHERAPMSIARMETWHIDNDVKALQGNCFFDWMAARIDEMLAKDGSAYGHEREPLPMGLAWSFPVEQTSIRSGTLLGMGKGFRASHGVLGEDLGLLIARACQRRNLNVRMDAIVNDASATLLARAYVDGSTRLALILGTGVNAAIHLPVSALALEKFGSRPADWHEKATHVLVNTELSMFGKGIFPTTQWDEQLNKSHSMPDYQPFEHLVGGRYLGEIVRLILVEGVDTGLFGGILPQGIAEPYSFSSTLVGAIDADHSCSLEKTRDAFSSRHPCTATRSDLEFLQRACKAVSRRAQAYIATSIHALWSLRNGSEPGAIPPRIAIGCNGSVIEKYPGFKSAVQSHIDRLVADTADGTSVVLEPAIESAIFGAAVAVSCTV